MVNEYPNLVWALTLNTELKLNLFEKYENKPRYLSYLDNLIFELRDLDCKNIQEKMKDINANLYKLSSIISELEIAKILAKSGKKVQLLLDNFLVGKSPDILCKDENFDAYIEVTRIGESESTFKVIDFLRVFLKDLPYRVDVKLKGELSLPARDYQKRRVQECIVKTSLDKFKEYFRGGNFSEFPFQIETVGIIFEINRTDSGKGYPGFVNTEFIQVPEEILKENIKYWLLEKAKKRDDLEKEDRKYPYIIAFDCEERSIDDITINELLYGQRTTIGALSEEYELWREKEWRSIIKDKAKKIPKWEEIEEARKRGWEKLLVKEALIPNDYTYLTKEGIFLSESSMKNVSGVLFRKYGEVFFFPNPFASDEINYPNIFKTFSFISIYL